MTRRQWWTVSLLLIAHKLWLPTLLSERLFSGDFPVEHFFGIFQLSAALYMLVMLALSGRVLGRFLPARRYLALGAALLALVPFFIAFRYGLEECLYPLLFGRGNYHPDTTFSYYAADNAQYALVYLVMGALLYFLDAHISDRRRLAALGEASREAELQYLRAQINPHFLFNSLNNIYALVQEQSPRASEALLHLTALSRMLIRSKAHEATAEEELRGLEPYLQLQALRYPFPLQLSVEGTGQLHAVSLPVFSLLSFVENMFKHGDLRAAASIRVEERNGQLELTLRNRIGQARSKDSMGGVGLANIRTRLELLYGNQATLKAGAQGDHFVVQLTIAAASHAPFRPTASGPMPARQQAVAPAALVAPEAASRHLQPRVQP